MGTGQSPLIKLVLFATPKIVPSLCSYEFDASASIIGSLLWPNVKHGCCQQASSCTGALSRHLSLCYSMVVHLHG